MMIDEPETLEKIRIVVGLGISARRDQQGKDDETIRREVLAVAMKSLRKHLPDEMERETAVATVQREIDRILAGGEPLADIPAAFPDPDTE